MTTPQAEPKDRDRTYRSSAGIVGGVLLLAIVGWLGIDALFTGHGRSPWLALAGLILAVPLIVAFTLRPAVYAGPDRLRIRNPFRIVVLPWAEVATLRSGYSNEVLTNTGAKFQLWAVPVSLRARKKAARREARAMTEATGDRRGSRPGLLGSGGGRMGTFGGGAVQGGPTRAESDQIMTDLRELLESRGQHESAQGEVTVRWAYEVIAPALAGAVVLAILLATG
ncbi:PH domain-containing protein [Streptomyces sp. NPDC101776]|uniref:PH domain-containing protein n=1 Tax=Streptomyces sp. NPDC101776 TaxID=3366146 RepID=UPI00380ED0E5